VLALLLFFWTVTVAVSGSLAYHDLQAARVSLLAAQSHLQDADFLGSEQQFSEVFERAERSSARLRAPHLLPLRVMPVIAPNLRAATALSDAARDVGGTAAELLATTRTVVGGGQQGPGEVPVDLLRAVATPVRRLADTLAASTGEVAGANHPWLLGRLADARAEYLGLAEPLVEQVSIGADVAEVMPMFLGVDGPRSYLVAAGALSELRGSSGLLGSFSRLTAEDGRLSFEEFADIDVLEDDTPDRNVVAPNEAFAARWKPLGGMRHWRNANLTPDLPSAAQVLLQMWERADRSPVDGLVVADAVAFERIVERSGPIEVPGIVTLTAENTRSFVGLDAYASFETAEERKLVLGAVATAAFKRAFETLEDDDVISTVAMFSALVRGGHLSVYSRDPEVQQVMVRAGVAGKLDERAGEFGAVVVNNVAANKVDYFTHRRTEHRVELLPGGDTRAIVRASFRNAAPAQGLPRGVLGPWADGADAGDNLSYVTHLCGIGCEVTSSPDGSVRRGEERGHPATDLRLLVPSGQERTVGFASQTPDGWHDTGGAAELVVRHRSQATINDDQLRVVVAIPPGFEVDTVPEGAEVVGTDVVWGTTSPDAMVTLRYRFLPGDNAA
jgi:hypothetical protein